MDYNDYPEPGNSVLDGWIRLAEQYRDERDALLEQLNRDRAARAEGFALVWGLIGAEITRRVLRDMGKASK